MQIGSKSQSSLEYLIVMGIAIFILAAAISYALYYQVGYNSAGTAQDLQLAATSIANAVNSLSGEGIGSSQEFSFSSPGLNLVSSICNTSISLSFGGEEASQSLSLYTTGELPISSGTYDGKVTLVKDNGKPEAQISMNLPISYISTSYIYNPSSVFYNVSFLDTKGNLVGDVNFTIIIYNHNKIIAEQNESTLSGYYSGSITPSNGGQFSPSSTAEIYVQALNIMSPSCFLPQQLLIIPKNVLNFIPLTIKNSQSTATSSPFQQEVVVDSANYQQYEASNLQNVEFFYPNGTIIDSWLESGNSNTATSSVYWLRLSGIPASSSITVYMGFASKSSNLFNNTNDGEAPQLSSTYAEYDDGANVFNYYENFAGTSLPSGWTSGAVSGSTITVDNGLTISGDGSSSGSTYVATTSQVFNNNEILEGYINQNSGATINERGLIGISTVNNGEPNWDNGGSSGDTIAGWSAGKNGVPDIIQSETVLNGAYSYLNSIPSNSNWNIYSVSLSSSSGITTSVNYGDASSTTSDNPSAPLYINLGVYNTGGGSSFDQQYQWIRIRAYPPDGIMPSVTFGPVQPQITVFVNGVRDGNNGIAYGDVTNITAFGIQASHIGLMINGSVVVPLGSASLSYQKPLSAGLYNITVFSNQSNLANQTYWEAVANVPKNVKNFVPISITNLQSSSTSDVFQQNISINSFAYNSFENKTLSNVEFFSPSGTVIPSWLESGDLAYFNGASSYANLPENYPFGTGSTFTISVWFKTTSDGVVLWNGNSEQVSSPSCYSPILYVNNYGNLAGGDWINSEPFNTTYFVANGKWNSVTIVQTPSEQILYLNGTEIATKTYSSSSLQSCSPAYWTIGEGYTKGAWANTNQGNFYFNGYITNIQFYNQAFPPSKVALLYDEGIAGSPLNSSGLIAWYLLAGNGNQQNGHNTLSINNIQFNGVSAASTSTDYWLKLGSIQPRESYIAFMGFALPNITLFNNTNDGEASQLSPVYGQYNDGPNVFDFYANFEGPSIIESSSYSTTNSTVTPSYTAGSASSPGYVTTLSNQDSSSSYLEWTSGPSSISNGLIMETSAYYGAPESSKPADQQILGLLSSSDPQEAGQGFIGCGGSGQPASTGVAFSSDPYCTSSFIEYDDSATTSSSSSIPNDDYIFYRFTVLPSSQTLQIASSSSSIFQYPYTGTLSTVLSASYSVSPSGSTVYVGDTSGGASHTARYYWILIRAYPPNGVMPFETVGPLNGQPS